MEKKETGLGRDRDANFVRQLESAAAFESLLLQENLHMPEQLRLIVRRQARKDGQVARDDLPPLRRKRCRPKSLTSQSSSLGDFHCRKPWSNDGRATI